MNVERGDPSAGGAPPSSAPPAATAAGNDVPVRSFKGAGRDTPAPESGPVLKPSAELAPDTYAVGQVLAGKYRVERLIGEGAMGLVLAATHLGLDEVVAIKFIRAEVQRLPGTLSRFAKEAKIAARIRNEHVTKVIDVGVSDPIGPYIVMEYLEGRSLADVLDADGPLSVQRAAEYLLQACEGLAAAHANGVTHRDIKPENLYITGQPPLEVVKLLDFGISQATLTGRVFGDDLALSKSSFVMGTPLYMSPEQIRAAPQLDSRTDIWSMGAVLYELVSGKTAFSAESMTEICAKILETPAPRLAHPCPPELIAVQAIIEKCLEKEPERRFQSVADLALALLPLASERARAYAERSSNLLGASRTSASNPGLPPASIPAPERRRRSRAASLALFIFGLATAALLTKVALRFAEDDWSLDALTQALKPAPSVRANPAERSPARADGLASGPPTPTETIAVIEPSVTQELAPRAPVRPVARPEKKPKSSSERRTASPERQAPEPEATANKQERPALVDPERDETKAPLTSPPAAGPSQIRLVEARPRLRLVQPPAITPRAKDATHEPR